MAKAAISYGNVVTGFKFIGPFDSDEDASDYANNDPMLKSIQDDWAIVELVEPDTELDEDIDFTEADEEVALHRSW